MSKTDLPILKQREIEANIIKPIYEEMAAELGEGKAREILGAAIRKNAIAQGKAYAEAEGGEKSLLSFHALLPQWKAEGALETEILAESEPATIKGPAPAPHRFPCPPTALASGTCWIELASLRGGLVAMLKTDTDGRLATGDRNFTAHPATAQRLAATLMTPANTRHRGVALTLSLGDQNVPLWVDPKQPDRIHASLNAVLGNRTGAVPLTLTSADQELITLEAARITYRP